VGDKGDILDVLEQRPLHQAAAVKRLKILQKHHLAQPEAITTDGPGLHGAATRMLDPGPPGGRLAQRG